MVPSGLLPAVKIDGDLITESMDIMLRLEQEFPERSLLPSPGSQESKALQVREGPRSELPVTQFTCNVGHDVCSFQVQDCLQKWSTGWQIVCQDE